MSMGLEQFKLQYNTILARNKKAELYLDNPDGSTAEKEKWIPEFNNITKKLSEMIAGYKELTGKAMTNDEILNGFILRENKYQ